MSAAMLDFESQQRFHDTSRGSLQSTASSCFYMGLASLIRWTPVFFVVAVLTFSYFVYITRLAVADRDVGWASEDVLYNVLFHILLMLLLWSFAATIVTSPGEVPDSWRLSTAMATTLEDATTEEEWKSYLELFAGQMALETRQRSVQGAMRYCDTCHKIKPDRCHHCSACRRCILKMDHHCPWVNNCVGFKNYKFFMLFVSYAYAYCLLVAHSLLVQSASSDYGAAELLLALVVVVFFVFLSSLFWYHSFLIVCNRTTLEQFRAPVMVDVSPNSTGTSEDKYAWNLGRARNIGQVFGGSPITFFLPVPSTPGDGIHFSTRKKRRKYDKNHVTDGAKNANDVFV